MDIRWMAATILLIVCAILYGRWRVNVNRGLRIAAIWLFKIALDPKTCGVAETFFVEAAVLWFVFPVLDTIYEHRDLSSPLIHQSYELSLLFFICSVFLSHASKPKKEE